jgi:adenylate cyclase, class 2
MNEEIEIQVILKNPKEIEEKLKPFFVKEKKQKDEYFIPKHKNFFEEIPITEYLRVRYEEGNNNVEYQFLHFKENDPEDLIKTDEYSTKIEDPKMMSIILKKLGMTNNITVKKHRKYFNYKDFDILIDHIEGLGHFIEIEAKKIIETPEETRKLCYRILEEIKAKWEQPKIGGYPRMLLAKNK